MVDRRIWSLYEQGRGCRVIAAELGENPAFVYKRVRAMGIARGREETYPVNQKAPLLDLPFQVGGSDDRLRAAAIGEAVAWFLRHGYVPSIPVEPVRYDLIVESDDGLKRVQVKSTTYQERGRWVVRISRLAYGRADRYNSNGRRGETTYQPDEVDFFFIVTGSGDKYLVPLAATSGVRSITLDRKYASYKVQ